MHIIRRESILHLAFLVVRPNIRQRSKAGHSKLAVQAGGWSIKLSLGWRLKDNDNDKQLRMEKMSSILKRLIWVCELSPLYAIIDGGWEIDSRRGH